MEASISSMEGSRCALLAVAIVTPAAAAHDPENRSSIFEEDQAQNQSSTASFAHPSDAWRCSDPFLDSCPAKPDTNHGDSVADGSPSENPQSRKTPDFNNLGYKRQTPRILGKRGATILSTLAGFEPLGGFNGRPAYAARSICP
ncbi:hypothetical protein NKI32_06225 [Mesorhizobium sp. M0761]|uniref:hypothetical protein n=1 Tax=Mesorhizobium sp. M0761 TaxID=2956994 RepID=UPI003336E6DF